MSIENAHATAGRLEVVSFVVGPVATNAYLIGDPVTREAAVIDPGWDGERLVAELRQRAWQPRGVWLTHAHFDHFGGTAAVAAAFDIPVALHSDDRSLWGFQGGAALFGVGRFDPGPEPTIDLFHGMTLHLGSHQFEVRHTPGHSPGHVVFAARDSHMVFCGDLIFQMGVGRTDIPGGDWDTLLRSIRTEIFSLPDETVLYPGHGAATSVGEERRCNPFVADG
jgi:hydroxyacylglutathione hydrolase